MLGQNTWDSKNIKLIKTENRIVVDKGWGNEGNGEMLDKGCKLSVIK